MDTTGLSSALTTVESALWDLERELAAQEKIVSLLRERRDQLATTATHLRKFLEEIPRQAEPESPPRAEAGNGDAAVDVGRDVGLPIVRPKTTDGIVKILDDLGGEGSLEDIRREFRDRGWLDPMFKKPDAALYAAAQRLMQAGRVERLGGGRYRLLPINGTRRVELDPM